MFVTHAHSTYNTAIARVVFSKKIVTTLWCNDIASC
jgi:hypothetical protein